MWPLSILTLLFGFGGPPQDLCPGLPQGTLAFSSVRDGMEDIYTMHLDGSGLTRVTADTLADSEPAWSPDGRLLAFQSRRPFWRIYTIRPDGSGEEPLTDSLGWSPSWAPSGEEIAFSNGPSIMVIPTAGGSARVLTSGEPRGRPSWMPDGRRLLFHASLSGSRHVFLLHPPSGDSRRLTEGSGRNFQASPSPDGSLVAFASDRDGDMEIFLMDSHGSQLVQLTENTAEDFMPAWSPDGEWLAFVSDRDGNREIYVVKRDGTCPRRVTRNEGDDIFPAWRPERDGLAPPGSGQPAAAVSYGEHEIGQSHLQE